MDDRKNGASTFLPASRRNQDGNPAGTFLLVGIGASAGGLGALEKFFSSLSETQGLAIVVIVHLSPEHESRMAELLQQHTKMPVSQVSGRVRVEAEHVYVIPPGKKLEMTDGHIDVSERLPHDHLPIDHFFRTLAESHGTRAVAIVLSGNGNDGSLGLERIRVRGGLTMVESPEEAEFDSMPRSAVATGHADVILPVAELATALAAYRRRLDRLLVSHQSESFSPEEASAFAGILEHVRERTGNDFCHYKRGTLLRRLTRRLHLTGRDDLTSYLAYLRSDSQEVEHLLHDLLISVTNFFRDPDSFAALETEIIPKMFDGKAAGSAVRAWVCGCATGEEAYTVAILLREEAERRGASIWPQVFASDISEQALVTAREGLYRSAIASQVRPGRLERFFDPAADGYQTRNVIREMIIFAAHNLLRDPPFSRLDLITCRNLLIYLDRSIHEHVFELFHYALLPGGYLFLGDAESMDNPDLFAPVQGVRGLYRRRGGRSVFRPTLRRHPSVSHEALPPAPATTHAVPPTDIETLHLRLVAPHAPASLIVNADHDVVHTLGGGEEYLAFTPGRPTHDVFKIVREELRLELRTALYRAVRKGERSRSRAIQVRLEGKLRDVELIVEPIDDPEYGEDHVHLVINDLGPHERGTAEDRSETPGKTDLEEAASEPRSLEEAEVLIRHLEDELDHARRQLESTTKEHDAASEQMLASNEEMQSINEELRSTAEELETSKEELQSVNEELLALNDELERKIDEVKESNSDLQNLMDATEIATIFLDRDLRIKRCTPAAMELFDIAGPDEERSLPELSLQWGMDDLSAYAARVLRELTMVEREVQHAPSEQWFLVRLRAYHNVDGKIDGVVITFVDVTEKKRYDKQLEALVETMEGMLSARAEQIHQLASDLVLAEQSERQRIAQILHDDLQQLLVAFQMKAAALTSNLSTEQRTRLDQATSLIDRAVDVARTLTSDLSPPVLATDDITATLEWLALRMEQMHDLKVDIGSSAPLRLPPDLRMLVYQAARELLFNVVKHAGVDHAEVNVKLDDSQIVFVVEDEGAGYDPAAAGEERSIREGGFGLESVRQRVHHFGGRLEMESVLGVGTRATLYVPLPDEATARQPAISSHEDSRPATDPVNHAIYIVDDNALVREALVIIIQDEPDLDVAGASESAADALELVPRLSPDLVLTDLSLPDMTGIEFVERLLALKFRNRIAVLSAHSEPDYVEQALAAGAHGYILKGEPEAMVEGIRHVLSGDVFVSPSVRPHVRSGS